MDDYGGVGLFFNVQFEDSKPFVKACGVKAAPVAQIYAHGVSASAVNPLASIDALVTMLTVGCALVHAGACARAEGRSWRGVDCV